VGAGRSEEEYLLTDIGAGRREGLRDISGIRSVLMGNSTMLRRWLIYLNEVFLPVSRTLISLVLVVGIPWLYQAMLGRSPLAVTWDTVPAVATLVLILLYYRVQDEFKDADTDRTFFPDRPVPSGRVSLGDLNILMWTVFVLLFAINLAWRLVLVPFLVLFGFAVLMHNWFFLRRHLASNRLLAFVTHAPISLIGNYFVLAVYANRFDAPLFTRAAFAVAVWFALPSLAWEIARKTRAPSEEVPGYQTYSAMIGSAPAALLSIGFVVAQCALAFVFPVSRTYLLILVAITVAYTAWFAGFAAGPAIGSARLKPIAEVYGLISTAGLIVDLGITRGIAWNGWLP
jgi:4-hydroxybenzoate polyprenyltransferase